MLVEPGRGSLYRGAVAENASGCRIVGIPASPSPAMTTGCRPISSAKAMPASTVLMGPHGTPAATSSRNHSAAGRSLSRSTSSGRSSSRLAVRSPVFANRGSSASSGAPSTSHSLRNWTSLPAVTMRSPAPVGSGSYGNRLGWELPMRNGTTPPAA